MGPAVAALDSRGSSQTNLDPRGVRTDFPAVNTRTVGRIPLAFSIGIALAGCASNTHVVSMGHDTYAITCEAVTLFANNTEALKAKARDEAAQFCASKGKQMKEVDVAVEKSRRSTGFAKAKIVFRAVDAANPDRDRETAAAPAREKPVNVDLLYKDLIKLDDLHKKSILSDEEFQGVKKKVLDHSQ